MEQYTIKLKQFEGPFDLLLFFIERDELDIYDIPIATITNDFLAYIQHLEALNIDVASEFILVAASLMRIKAKMLIPRKELDEFGQEIDPRAELTQKLLEYKRYKEVFQDFEKMEEERTKRFFRGGSREELLMLAQKSLVELELESLSLYRLFSTFQKLMERFENQQNITVHRIQNYAFTIEGQRKYILSKLYYQSNLPFEGLFEGVESRIQAVITFLALLEMLNLQLIQVTLGDGSNNFWIQAVQPPDESE